MNIRMLTSLILLMTISKRGLGQTRPEAKAPGEQFLPPTPASAANGPVVFEYSREAGPDQTFFMVGERFAGDVIAWGPSASKPGGQEWKPRVQLHKGAYLSATLPEQAPDGLFLVQARNSAGFSQPVVLNKPEPWWCGPDTVRRGEITRVFGRNLSRRPDFARGFVYVCKPGQQGVWAKLPQCGKYSLSFVVPDSLAPARQDQSRNACHQRAATQSHAAAAIRAGRDRQLVPSPAGDRRLL